MLNRQARVTALMCAALAACGPTYAPPNAPAYACPNISEAEYDAAIEAGAARATAHVDANGMVSMETGPGIVHCATFRNSTILPCRRPTDFVISYTVEGGESFHVRVPAGEQYRFRVQRAPNTCEILER